MFLVDDLVGWLVGRVANAGYQKLTTRLLGSDQARALKEAVTAAVQGTVAELGFSGGDADWVAEQINRAFGRRDPVPLPPEQATVLEALQAGIAGQLNAEDDAGQRVVNLPGVPASEVAAKLTGHLVREIQARGSRGGPLAELADQLNHDLTHLQGQRLEGMLAQVLDWLGPRLAPPGGAAGPQGWPLTEVADPFALEVHRPFEPDVPQSGLPVLPAYVSREHDTALSIVVVAAATGASGIAVLVGESSTGKTRACWQALELLREQEPRWRLWHPVDSQAALAEMPGVEPRTVVWLNEAQRYLDTPDGAGERVAARLRELLRDRSRGPVIVLATLWRGHWAELTVRPPPGGADLHAQARELLADHDIRVPDAFTGDQLRQLEGTGDPRLAQAAAKSRDGQLIQYLAGAPELLKRYEGAPPDARALIHAAMDARRLGMGPTLPRAFLKEAAPGYLTDAEWELLSSSWLEQVPNSWLKQGLDYTATPAKGIRGPLTPFRPRPGQGALADAGDQAPYQLADYLDQLGRRERREQMPPEAFWEAVASQADAADLINLAQAAKARGLYRYAARMNKQASADGHAKAGARLVRLLHALQPGDHRPADWAVAHASLDDPAAVAALLRALLEAGAAEQVAALIDRDPAAHASVDDLRGVADLSGALHEMGAAVQVTALGCRVAGCFPLDDPAAVASLLRLMINGVVGRRGIDQLLDRDPAAHVSLDDRGGVVRLIRLLDETGRRVQVTVLAERAVAHLSPDDPHVAMLLRALRNAGASGQAAALASRAAAHASLDDPYGVPSVLKALREMGEAGLVTVLLDRDPAAHASLGNPGGVAALLEALLEAGASGQAAALASRAAAHASLDDPHGVARLLEALREAGSPGEVAALASRAAAHASLDDPGEIPALLRAMREAGASGQVTAVLDRDPGAHASLDDPRGVARLLEALLEAGASGQAAALASRAAAHASLDDPRGVARLLEALREAGSPGEVAALASRAAAHASLDDSGEIPELLQALREAGTRAQAAELIERLPASGQFDLFCRQEDRAEKFRFGREADGRPSKPWAWTDLG